MGRETRTQSGLGSLDNHRFWTNPLYSFVVFSAHLWTICVFVYLYKGHIGQIILQNLFFFAHKTTSSKLFWALGPCDSYKKAFVEGHINKSHLTKISLYLSTTKTHNFTDLECAEKAHIWILDGAGAAAKPWQPFLSDATHVILASQHLSKSQIAASPKLGIFGVKLKLWKV